MPKFVSWLLLLAVTNSEPPAVALTKPHPVLPGIDAFPRIASPRNGPERHVNMMLDRLDVKVRSAAKDCLSGTNHGDWSRQIDTPMQGPEFISYVVTDDVDCGGAHPNTGHSAIVYDLRSGQPVDWTGLLPRSLTGKLDLTEGEDGVRVVTLSSSRLFALYRRGYEVGPPDPDQKECRDAVEAQGGGGPVPMLVWLDAKADGIVLQFDFAHVEQACSEPVVISAASLRREGASARLLSALAAAHRLEANDAHRQKPAR